MAAVDLKTGENVSWRIFTLVVATVSGVGRRERSFPCLLGSKVRGQRSSYTCIEYLWVRSRSCANIPESLSTVPLLSSRHHELCCFCSGLWPGPAAIPAKERQMLAQSSRSAFTWVNLSRKLLLAGQLGCSSGARCLPPWAKSFLWIIEYVLLGDGKAVIVV